MSFTRRSGRSVNLSDTSPAFTTQQGSRFSSRFANNSPSPATPNYSQTQQQKQKYQQVTPVQQSQNNASQQFTNQQFASQPQQQTPAQPAETTSATTKALEQMETDTGPLGKKIFDKAMKKRLPFGVRKTNMSKRLIHYLAPRSAVMLVNQLKPGCVYNVTDQPGYPTTYLTSIEFEGQVLGKGEATTKVLSKNKAAEEAVKIIVSQQMEAVKAVEGESKTEAMEESDGDCLIEPKQPDSAGDQVLPWVDLASYALYRLFNDWQSSGTKLPLVHTKKKTKSKKSTAEVKVEKSDKRELPPKAAEMHPVMVFHTIYPGLQPVELNREPPPKSSVTLGYQVDGFMYTGTASNKKNAKKEAAKAALKALYNLEYKD